MRTTCNGLTGFDSLTFRQKGLYYEKVKIVLDVVSLASQVDA